MKPSYEHGIGKMIYNDKEIPLATIGGSGSDETTGEYFVKVIDYDGTVLKEARLNEGDTFTLPNAPSHDGLVFQEWSCSQEMVDNTITIADNNVMVGAVYTTASGLSEFDIELTKVTGLDVTFNMDGTKDCGDGSSDDLTTHTYTTYGKYTIKCNGTTMTTSYSSGLFGQSSGVMNYYCTSVRLANVSSIRDYVFLYCYSLTNITIPSSVTSIGLYAFAHCYSLTNITIPSRVTSIGIYAFSYCYSLTDITIQSSVTNIGNYAFYYCYSLTSMAMPSGVTSVGDSVFTHCYSLTNITIPSGVAIMGRNIFHSCYSLVNVTISSSVTNISEYAFYHCSLTNIKIPNSVTSIGSNGFNNCYSIIEYDFSDFDTPPTLSGTNAFTGINGIAKILVKDVNALELFKTATNWATYADYMYIKE